MEIICKALIIPQSREREADNRKLKTKLPITRPLLPASTVLANYVNAALASALFESWAGRGFCIKV